MIFAYIRFDRFKSEIPSNTVITDAKMKFTFRSGQTVLFGESQGLGMKI